MATVKTSQEPETTVAEANGVDGATDSEIVRLDISDPTFMATAYDTYAAMRERGRVGVVKFAAGEDSEAPDGPEEFRPLARSIIAIDPPDHTRIRKLVQPSFTGRGMEAMRPGIQQVVDALLDRAEREAAARGESAPNRRMELIRAFAYPFPVTVISDMLGIPGEDREQIRGWTENLLRVD